NDGACTQLLKKERQRFVEKEWPKVVEMINRLGLDTEELLRDARKPGETGDGK
ncbi:MAG: GntR family transcriptional regulator, partial [Proteobacteria bacterium]|nr:GntR family transcriptional regulator [Pseudomonadota bacterium]